MSTTQRSESINALFDGYVNSKTTLKQFVEQYQYAYTIAKFKEFQQELAAKRYCEISSCKDVDSYKEFIVKEVVVGETRHRDPFLVCFDEGSCDVRCNCRSFEFRGILCRHAIAMLFHKDIYQVPEKYILRRWKKNIYRCHTKVRISYNSWSTDVEGQRFDQLCNAFAMVADLASSNDDAYNRLMQMISDMKNEFELTEKAGMVNKSLNMFANCITDYESVECNSKQGSSIILTPRSVRSKGRLPIKRKQSKIEQIVRKVKKNKLQNQVGSSQQSIQATEAGAFAINVQEGEVGGHVVSQGYMEVSVSSKPAPADAD